MFIVTQARKGESSSGRSGMIFIGRHKIVESVPTKSTHMPLLTELVREEVDLWL